MIPIKEHTAEAYTQMEERKSVTINTRTKENSMQFSFADSPEEDPKEKNSATNLLYLPKGLASSQLNYLDQRVSL